MSVPLAEFDQTIEDIKAFYSDALPRSPITRRQMRFILILAPFAVVGGGFLLAYLLGQGFPPKGPTLIFIGLSALVAMYFTPTTVYGQQLKQVLRIYRQEDRRKLLGPTKVELRADGVGITSPEGTALVEWAKFTEIAARPTYVFLHLDSLAALIIPNRGFADQAAFERFIDAARLYHRNAASAKGES